jgi:hypothetical protein
MIVEHGAHGVTTYFVLRDSSEHQPNPNISVTDIDIYYVKSRGQLSLKADCVALESATAEWVSNGAYNVGQGLYRIDWPDEAFVGEANITVQLVVVCFGIDTTYLEVLLSPHISEIEENIDIIEENVNTITEDISTIKSSQSGEETGISTIQEDIATIKSNSMVDLSYVVEMLGGNRLIVGNQMIFYKSDGITEIARFDLFDHNGKPSMINVFRRDRVV